MPSNKSISTGLAVLEKGPTKVLGLTVGKHNITEPGQYVPRADAQSPPQLTFPGASASKSYVVVGLDLDAPFPSFQQLGPVLHWLQSDLKAGTPPETTPLEATEPFIADYIGPAPPPGSAPHRYVFFLYEQPEKFDGLVQKYAPKGGKKLGVFARMWASLDDWEKKLGLGEVIAANYFKSN